MNPSHGPENVVKIGSKFIRMKQKLQLKVDGDKAGLHQEQDVLEEGPIASQLPPEHPPAGEHEGNPPAAMHDRNLPGNEDDTRPVVVKKKNESNFNSASPMKIVRVCKAISPAQQNLISKSDFGDIIQMKCSKLNPELCRFLMSSFDPIKCELDFGDRGKIPVTEESVFKVMGVHMGGSTVPYHLDVDATSLILEMLGIQDGVQPNITTIEKELGPGYPADDAYLRKFVIYHIWFLAYKSHHMKISWGAFVGRFLYMSFLLSVFSVQAILGLFLHVDRDLGQIWVQKADLLLMVSIPRKINA